MPAVLSPSSIATTFVSIDEGTDADIVVRRSRLELLRRRAFDFVCIALLVAIVPMFVVIWRREPAYFTNGVVITMLVVAIAILVLGVLGVYLWSISTAGRRRFDQPFLGLNAAGVTVRVDDSEETLRWSRITAMRLVGANDRSLAIMVDEEPAEATTVNPGADAQSARSSAEDLSNPTSDYLPPDSSWQPTRADFDAITSKPDTANERPGQDGDEVAEAHSCEPRDVRWRRALYGTPYVVQMRGCTPPLSEIRPIVHNLSHGRISIPELSDGALIRRWRSIRAKRATKS